MTAIAVTLDDSTTATSSRQVEMQRVWQAHLQQPLFSTPTCVPAAALSSELHPAKLHLATSELAFSVAHTADSLVSQLAAISPSARVAAPVHTTRNALVLVATVTGHVYALCAASGARLWSGGVGENVYAPLLRVDASLSAAGLPGLGACVLVTGSERCSVVLDCGTGRRLAACMHMHGACSTGPSACTAIQVRSGTRARDLVTAEQLYPRDNYSQVVIELSGYRFYGWH